MLRVPDGGQVLGVQKSGASAPWLAFDEERFLMRFIKHLLSVVTGREVGARTACQAMMGWVFADALVAGS